MVMEQAGEEIGRIVAALPLRQRLAFTLRKIHELEYEAIGRSLDCSPDTARAHVFQALRKIRRGLDAVAGSPMESAR
jgi:DNA-directed RNA polymerase specialized sigma24 family protein